MATAVAGGSQTKSLIPARQAAASAQAIRSSADHVLLVFCVEGLPWVGGGDACFSDLSLGSAAGENLIMVAEPQLARQKQFLGDLDTADLWKVCRKLARYLDAAVRRGGIAIAADFGRNMILSSFWYFVCQFTERRRD